MTTSIWCVQNELGKGAFQELDQVKAVEQFCKYAGSVSSAKDIVPAITAALKVTLLETLLVFKLYLAPQ